MEDFFRFTDLTYYLGNKERMVKVSGELKPGDILVVKGPSGSGKSTLLKVMARLVKAESGEVIYKGENWYQYSPWDWRINVHYIPQKPVVFRGTVRENLLKPFRLSAVYKNKSFDEMKVKEYLDMFALKEEILEQEAKTLSGGEAARISIIRALLIEPSLLLLDEPTAYLDDENRIRVLHFLNRWVKDKPERGMILVSHQENDLDELASPGFLPIKS